MKNKKYLYGIIVFDIVFAVHCIIAFLLKQTVKYAVFSEELAVKTAFIIVGVVMFLLYFKGRDIVVKKDLIPVGAFYVISALIPPFVWLVLTITRCTAYIGSTDFNAIITKSDITLSDLINLYKAIRGFAGVVNSFISLFSSAMLSVIAGIYELIAFLYGTYKKYNNEKSWRN